MSRYAFAILLSLAVIGCNKPAEASSSSAPKAQGATGSVADLKIEDLEPGNGPAAANGDSVYVLYRGTLMNGTEFDGNMDSSFKAVTSKDPFSLVIGTGSVIKGWDEGLVGTKEGMVRRLTIPYAKAYGDAGSGDKIPPKSDLKFDVKILKVVKKGAEPEITAKTTAPGSGAGITENSKVVLKYSGTFLNGKVFDKRDSIPLTPVKNLVNGFGDALMGLKKGGKRTITFPPGSAQFVGMQSNQFMIIEVEVLDVK
jgi:FKBP-type peptidyl-prolyl cis-trans isomerase